jgi:hypothetical protein
LLLNHAAVIIRQNRGPARAGLAAQAMRWILVEHARRRNLKRGGGIPHVSFDEVAVLGPDHRGLVFGDPVGADPGVPILKQAKAEFARL